MWSMVGRCNTSAIERAENVGSPPKNAHASGLPDALRSRWSQGPQPRRIRKTKTRAATKRGSVSHEAHWIRKQRRGNQRGVLISSAVDPAGIPAVRVDGFANPHGRWKRPLGTANQAVKDTLSVPTLSRSFSGYSYGFQHPWPDQRPFVIIRGRSPVR